MTIMGYISYIILFFIIHLSISERRWQNNKFTSIMKYVIVDIMTEMASIILLSVDIRPFEQSLLLHTMCHIKKCSHPPISVFYN